MTQQGIQMEGHLEKKGGIRGNWLSRWFRLEVDCGKPTLAYFDKAVGGKQKGEISIIDCTEPGEIRASSAPSAPEVEFELECCDRTYRLRAESVAQRDAWLAKLRQCVSNFYASDDGSDASSDLLVSDVEDKILSLESSLKTLRSCVEKYEATVGAGQQVGRAQALAKASAVTQCLGQVEVDQHALAEELPGAIATSDPAVERMLAANDQAAAYTIEVKKTRCRELFADGMD